MIPVFIVLAISAGRLIQRMPLLSDISINGGISVGTLIVTIVVAVGIAYFKIKLAAQTHADEVWQSEASAQKTRAERLQVEKDELTHILNDIRVRLAEAEARPDMTTLKKIVETQADSGHRMAQTLMEQLASHDKHAMEGLKELSAEIRGLVKEMRLREQRLRKTDGD